MLMRRAVATVVRRRWVPLRPTALSAAYRQSNSRWIQTGGTIIEAEIVSPLENTLLEAKETHELLTSQGAASESLQSSLEVIRNLQFQLEEWQGSLESEEELYATYYQHSSSQLDLARSHNRFGILHQRLTHYDDSQRHFELSLQFYQELHPDTFHVEVGEAWNALAALAAEQAEMGIAMQNLHLAEPHFRYAGCNMFADINEETQKPHPELRKVLENQCEIMRLLHQYKEALALYTEIEDRLVLQGQPVDRDLLLHKADCLLAMGDPVASKKLYTLVMERHDVNPESLMAAAIHHQLGLVYSYEQQSNKFYDAEKALKNFSLAYQLRKRLLGDTHPQVGKTANAMGAIQASAMDNPGSALTNMREALVIARIHSTYPNDENDPEVKHILQNISLVQKTMEQSTFQAYK